MNTKKVTLLVLWLAGASIMLPAQWLNHEIRLTDKDEFSRSLFRVKPKPVRGETFLLPEKGYQYYDEELKKPTYEISYFYDGNGILKTVIMESLIPGSYPTYKSDYNQTITMNGVDMPDTTTVYYDINMTQPYGRTCHNWKLYEITPTDSFYFERINQMWDAPNKRWKNDWKEYYGFVDTVLWELNRRRFYQNDGQDGWKLGGYRMDSILYDDNGWVRGMISEWMGDDYKLKHLYTLNEDGSVRIDSVYSYHSDDQEVLVRMYEYEWQEWNGYGEMTLINVIGGDGLSSLFPWMKLRNKVTSRTGYAIKDGKKVLNDLYKKYWDTGPYNSNIDTLFVSLNDNPDNLYPFFSGENLYDAYGNYIKYSGIDYNPPDETGHQTMIGVRVDQYDYHYTDYGEHGIGCDTSMIWDSDWNASQQTYKMVFWDAEIITQYVDFTGIDKINDALKTLTIAPNPVTGIVTISATEDIEQLYIFDVMGRLVNSQSPTSRQVIFDTSVFPKGVYLVQAWLKDGGVQTGKVIMK